MDQTALASVDGVHTTQPGHIGVSEVIRGVGNALRRAFPTSLWVKGEVSDYRPSGPGHHYFSLVERLADGSQAVLPCAIWKRGWPAIRQRLLAAGVALNSGQEMLLQGTIRLYDGAGKLTFHVSDVYPEFTLGQIEAQRRAVLARLKRENLVGLNRRLEMPPVPLRVAVLSSRTAAGLRDFEDVLSNSGYAFSVLRCEVPVQGTLVEQTVCRALELLALKQAELKLDAVCIVRGGGSATDLGWWNSYAICAAIARMPVPVITGIGHERDRVAADEVAYTPAPTPTGAAEILCGLVLISEAGLRHARGHLAMFATRRLSRVAQAIKTMKGTVAQAATAGVAEERVGIRSLREQSTAHARRSLAPHNLALRQCRMSLGRESGRTLRLEAAAVGGLTSGIIAAAKQRTHAAAGAVVEIVGDVSAVPQEQLAGEVGRQAEFEAEVQILAAQDIAEAKKRLKHLEDMVQAHDPVRILRRGFSITLILGTAGIGMIAARSAGA
jgi:exodeoxyribonuclease VII large subunit